MLKILLLLGLSHTAALVDGTPYCALRYRRLCQGKGRHVACRFPVPGPGLSCQNYTQIKFTSDLKNFIVHYINKRRQRIAAGKERVRGGVHLPRPQIMMLVSWDRELAKLAQRLADQCQFVHDDCRATVRYPYAGQSVGEVRWRSGAEGEAASLGAQRAIRRVLDAWWGERRRVYARQLIAPFRLTTKDMVWGHFSQLAVWRLQAVGCGAVRHGFQHTRMLLVCDFSHTNMLGQRTMTPGPLAPCPMHTERRPRSAYPLLCAPLKIPTSTEKDDREIIKGYDYSYDEDVEDDEEEERITQATRAIAKYRTTTQRAIDKFEQDIDLSSSEPVTMKKYRHWETRRLGFGRSHVDSENEDYAIFSKAKQKLIHDEAYDDEDTKPEDEGNLFTRADGTANQVLNSRQRWKQARIRPQRPGANALLKKAPEKHIQRSSMIPFLLDKDHSDQLFRDTGFHVNWRKQIQE
ncbi:uncharacterized protein LOC123877829 [Maniola jurtina]|uniref:uncharacterized protein LOC123877829 n=1 Tax=Maniola jurtina TaxID=191418 RepID=UPI001E68DF45|nr:uncharacterized protein LOC123877829 [Maniola jurtina]